MGNTTGIVCVFTHILKRKPNVFSLKTWRNLAQWGNPERTCHWTHMACNQCSSRYFSIKDTEPCAYDVRFYINKGRTRSQSHLIVRLTLKVKWKNDMLSQNTCVLVVDYETDLMRFDWSVKTIVTCLVS